MNDVHEFVIYSRSAQYGREVFWQPAKKKKGIKRLWMQSVVCTIRKSRLHVHTHTKKGSGWTTESKIRFRKCKSGQLAPQLRVRLYNKLGSPAAGPKPKRWATSNDCGERWEREVAGMYISESFRVRAWINYNAWWAPLDRTQSQTSRPISSSVFSVPRPPCVLYTIAFAIPYKDGINVCSDVKWTTTTTSTTVPYEMNQ